MVGVVANAYLIAASPECDLLEYPTFEGDPALEANASLGMYPFDLAFDLLMDELSIEQGTFSVLEGPGLSVDIDLNVIEQYPHREGAWTESHIDTE